MRGDEVIEDVAAGEERHRPAGRRRGAGTGTAACLREFCRAEWSRAVRLAALLTQHASVAEDLAHDAFTRMYPRWGQAANPGAYLRTSVVNSCRQWERHNNVEKAKLRLIATPEASGFVAAELADVVASLPYRQRAVVVLRYYADLSVPLAVVSKPPPVSRRVEGRPSAGFLSRPTKQVGRPRARGDAP
ncbi:MAG: hypothetical protein M3Z46_11745, partial [Actinomycetota bacterium]|nr:hypothetical protein [Actinomycetota bacterium]